MHPLLCSACKITVTIFFVENENIHHRLLFADFNLHINSREAGKLEYKQILEKLQYTQGLILQVM